MAIAARDAGGAGRGVVRHVSDPGRRRIVRHIAAASWAAAADGALAGRPSHWPPRRPSGSTGDAA